VQTLQDLRHLCLKVAFLQRFLLAFLQTSLLSSSQGSVVVGTFSGVVGSGGWVGASVGTGGWVGGGEFVGGCVADNASRHPS